MVAKSFRVGKLSTYLHDGGLTVMKALPAENMCSSVQTESAVSGGAKSLSLLATLEVVWLISDLGRDTEQRIKKTGQTSAELEKTTLSQSPPAVSLFSPFPSLFHDLISPDPFHWTWLVSQPISYLWVHTKTNVDKQTSFKALWATS